MLRVMLRVMSARAYARASGDAAIVIINNMRARAAAGVIEAVLYAEVAV